MTPKYQGSLRGRTRQWTFQLLKEGATLVSSDHDISLTTGLRYGQNANTKFLDRFIIPASLDISITDPGAIIWQDIRTSGKFDFKLRVFDSNRQYEIDLFVKLANAFTPLNVQTQVAVTKLKCFCGLTRTKDQLALATDTRTIHQVFEHLLVDQIHSQDIQYIFGTHLARITGTTPYVQAIRFPDLDWLYHPDDEDPDQVEAAGDQLTDFAETFQAMVFNDFHYGRRWMVAQPWLLGRDLSAASRNAALYDVDLDTVSENTLPGIIETNVVDDDTQRGLYDGDQAVVVTINKKRDAVTDIIIDKGDFSEGWSGGSNIFWEESSPSALVEELGGAHIEDGGESIWQKQLLVQKGKWVRCIVDFEYAMEYTPAGSGNHAPGWKYMVEPIDADDDTYYATNVGGPDTWTTTDTTQTEASATPDANGTPTASLTWNNVATFIVADYMPVDGYLRLEILGDTGNDYFLHVRNYRVRFEDQAASSVTDTPPWPGRIQSVPAGGSITEGDTITYNRPFHPVMFERDATDHLLVEVDVGGGSFEECNQWQGASVIGQAGPYWDLSEYQARIRLARGAQLQIIKGVFLGILTPGTIIQKNDTRFIVTYCDIDLHTETSKFLAYEDLMEI